MGARLGSKSARLGLMRLASLDAATSRTSDLQVAGLTFEAIPVTRAASGTATIGLNVATLGMGAVDINQSQASDLATATMTLTAIPVTFTLGTATRDLAVEIGRAHV